MENLINGLKNNRAFAFSSFLVLLLIGIALAAPLLAPYDPLEATMKNAYLPPSSEHLFGTDKLGRDNFSRVLYGASYSLSSVLLLVAVIFAVGTSLGVLAGYFGGKVDTVIISHGHFDHGGALKKFLDVNSSANIYVQKEAFEPHYSKTLLLKIPVGIDSKLKSNRQIILLDGDYKIDDELSLFSVC